MKKRIFIIIVCAALLCLAGCGARVPSEAVDGTPWSADWITLGNVLGVEKPGHSLTLRDDKAAKKMYYASWSIGEAQSYTTAEGNETELYDAQLVFLLKASNTARSAQASVDEWLDMAEDVYVVTDTAQRTYNGQEFTVLTYEFPSGINPFSRGVSAFTVYGSCAISAEFSCQDTFEENAGEILADVLEHCHYAAE